MGTSRNSIPLAENLVRDGQAALRRGDAGTAERRALEALEAVADFVPALKLRAVASSALARHAEAARDFQALARREPHVRGHLINLGTSLRALGQLDAALQAYQRAATMGERSADFLYNLGLLQVDRGDHEAARLALRDAHLARPDDGEIACHYAAACCETLDMHEGLAALARWQSFERLDTELLAKIGIALMTLGDMPGANLAFERALADPAPHAAALLRLVDGLERANRLDQAGDLLARLRRHPGRGALGSDLLLAEAKLAQREARHEDAVGAFRRLAAECTDVARRHFHLYPLAKSLDALGRHAEAFDTLVEAHASQDLWIQRTSPEVPVQRSDTMRVTRFGCDPADVARWDHAGAPPAGASPVFIVAFPRSGTTLLEQTLDAHPRLRTMDEQPYLQNAIARLSGPGVHYPDRMAALTRAQLDDARDYYWSLVRRRVELQPGQQLIDKNPLNILRLPAIARLFPNSRIVLAIRHPCDVLLSCFMQHFRAEFAWNCRDLGTLALAYQRSFDFWREQSALLRPTVREVRYEAFVAQFEAGVRDLAAFLDLPWTDAMLEPGAHASRRGFISTPSYAQVVQPVHARSVGRWRAYEPRFRDAIADLDSWLARWGYAA